MTVANDHPVSGKIFEIEILPASSQNNHNFHYHHKKIMIVVANIRMIRSCQDNDNNCGQRSRCSNNRL